VTSGLFEKEASESEVTFFCATKREVRRLDGRPDMPEAWRIPAGKGYKIENSL